GRIAQFDGAALEYFLGDALGSVRQLADEAGEVTLARRYEPYGDVLESVGTGTTNYDFTGEWRDSSVGVLYLRARWLDPESGRFLSKDTWRDDSRPLSLNGWAYVEGDPINRIDPSGHAPNCPVGRWDCEAVRNVHRLKDAFLGSAKRHNRIPTMDNNGFAGLIAATIVSERRIGNVPPNSDPRSRRSQQLENLVASFGCTVSGGYLLDAWSERDFGRLLRYVTNQEVPARATVGIGNVWLETAANLWKGQACSSLGDCTTVELSTLQTTNSLGMTIDINNPFRPQIACGLGGVCGIGNQSESAAYVDLTLQLLDNEMNIEYVAANLEAGALRAATVGLTPSAFNSATWHLRGLQTNEEIRNAGWNPGGAIYILDDLPTALQVLGLTSNWSLNTEPQYAYWLGR
ncbi:MAG: RHS repeat-associated core domain-containing protein, partial [Anaerolineales bacterium]|nr:RHS repeat-associated core domain-containing protein [Anaerolineales bacterium]